MTDNPKMPTLDNLIGYHLRRASAHMLNDFADMFENTGIRPTSFSVACVIGEQPGITSAEVCRVLGLQRANIVTLLAELETAGAIRREDDEGDRRSQRLFLSPSGEYDLERWRALAAKHEARVLSKLSAADRDRLAEMLRTIWSAA